MKQKLKLQTIPIDRCDECGNGLVRSENEIYCPKCGSVRESFEGV